MSKEEMVKTVWVVMIVVKPQDKNLSAAELEAAGLISHSPHIWGIYKTLGQAQEASLHAAEVLSKEKTIDVAGQYLSSSGVGSSGCVRLRCSGTKSYTKSIAKSITMSIAITITHSKSVTLCGSFRLEITVLLSFRANRI